ncbi:hypothetical protein RVR_8314 [Actinacidiphila reveromycinica]|uniref:Uncharacterized protein n=1 Tax=Actinacidiphila reveromycinica TaxID=659352 RepID=A0A7U3UVL0_9ACTN|nr:phage gp6-like head-tail connector protein [Streptomyces sp. SN-593]BBB01071.1 hypothetical protein RVR_8314 [Streptomyces sp. SN-593]
MSIVTLAEAKQQLRIADTDTSCDDEVQAYCDGITAVVEDYMHEVVEPRTVVEDVDGHRHFGRRFRLWSVPLISLTSVKSVYTEYEWDVSLMRPDPQTGLVRVLSGPPVRGLVEVTYQAGYEDVPVNYKRGALVVLQHNWETRRGVGALRSSVVGPEEIHNPHWMYSIPRKALEWLGSPRVVVG